MELKTLHTNESNLFIGFAESRIGRGGRLPRAGRSRAR